MFLVSSSIVVNRKQQEMEDDQFSLLAFCMHFTVLNVMVIFRSSTLQ